MLKILFGVFIGFILFHQSWELVKPTVLSVLQYLTVVVDSL